MHANIYELEGASYALFQNFRENNKHVHDNYMNT